MAKYYFYVLILTLCASYNMSSCTHISNNHDGNAQKGKYDCFVDSNYIINIEISSSFSHNYRYTQVTNIEGKIILIGLNVHRNQLDFINLTDRKTMYILTFESEGSSSMPSIKAFYYHNKDSIFLYNDYKLGLANSDGKFLFLYSINSENSSIKGLNFGDEILHIREEDPMYFDSTEGSLYFGLQKISSDQWSKRYYQGSICAKLNLSELTIKTLPINYANSYLKKMYGLLNNHNITFLKDKIIYNFNNSSDIYVYDKASEKIKVIEALSKYTQATIAPYEGQDRDVPALVRHANNNAIYLPVIYDPYNQNYYRLAWLPIKEEGEKRKAVLTILNSNFEKIAETVTPQNINPYFVSTPWGIPAYSQESSEVVNKYLFFKIQCSTSSSTAR